MSRTASQSDSPGREFLLCVLWLAATIAHFGLCTKLGWYYGRFVDIDVPQWLRTLDEVLLYSLSVASELAVLLVWWAVVLLAAWPLRRAVNWTAKMLYGEPGLKITQNSAKLMTPTFVFSLLSLFLFPVVAPLHSESPTGLDVAAESTSQEFGYYTVLGLHCLLSLTIMFVVLGLVIAWFDKKWRAVGWGFFVGLTLGVTAAGCFCSGLYPAMNALFARGGLFGSVTAYLTCIALVTALPQVSRRQTPFAPVGESVR